MSKASSDPKFKDELATIEQCAYIYLLDLVAWALMRISFSRVQSLE